VQRLVHRWVKRDFSFGYHLDAVLHEYLLEQFSGFSDAVKEGILARSGVLVKVLRLSQAVENGYQLED